MANIVHNTTNICFVDDVIYFSTGVGTSYWVYAALHWVLGAAICGSNGFVLCLFLRNKRLRSMANYYMMQLTIADFLLGVGLLFLSGYFLTPVMSVNHHVCTLRYAIFTFLAFATVMALFVMTVDRYIAVVHPMTYPFSQTRNRLTLATLGVWFPAFLLGFVLPLVWHNDCPNACDLAVVLKIEYIQFILVPFLPVFVVPLTLMYVRILRTANAQRRSIAQQLTDTGFPGTSAKHQGPGLKTAEYKLVKAGLVVFVVFYILWMPFDVVLAIQVYTEDGIYNQAYLPPRLYTLVLAALNSLVNPFIYAFRLPDFKREMRKMIAFKSSSIQSTSVHDIRNM